jgi:hypothetical protein
VGAPDPSIRRAFFYDWLVRESAACRGRRRCRRRRWHSIYPKATSAAFGADETRRAITGAGENLRRLPGLASECAAVRGRGASLIYTDVGRAAPRRRPRIITAESAWGRSKVGRVGCGFSLGDVTADIASSS